MYPDKPLKKKGTPLAVSRRGFLGGSAGLIIGYACPQAVWSMVDDNGLIAAGAVDGAATGFDGFIPDGFIRIGKDGRIVLVVPSSEMGQGIATTEAMLLAEELEVEMDQVEVALAPADFKAYAQPLLKNQITGGSTSVRAFYDPLRKAGAAARTMLVNAAAKDWGVAASECLASHATVMHPPSGRVAPYSELAELARLQPIPKDLVLKAPGEFRLIGKRLKRVDTPEKVNGKAKFGIDAKVPGMRYAAIAFCPTIGGKIKSVDDRQARALPGVFDILEIEDAVAVVGEHYWAAKKGLEVLQVEWDSGPNNSLSSAELWHQLRTCEATPVVAKVLGKPEEELAGGIRVEATYELPFLAHAALEPINTTIHARKDACDVWVSTQVPVDAQMVTAEILGLSPDQVKIHSYLIGGGFGRRLAVDTIQQATRFAKLADYPVKFIWTREQDIQQDRFRPAYCDRVVATLDDKTRLPRAFHHRTTGPTVLQYFTRKGWPSGQLDPDLVAGSVNQPYDILAAKWEWLRQDSPIAVNWWRGVGEGHNVFVVEGFIDELASAAGSDPVAYRRAMLGKNPRAKAVLDKVARASNWGEPLPEGHGRGVSLHQCFGSFMGLVVQVEVDEYGEVFLRRVTAAVDCGVPINPDSIEAQMQGGVLFGLSAALFNGVTFKEGRVEQSNFHDYRQIRLNEVPPFDVYVLPSIEPPGGVGEVGTAAAAPALTNAIFAATGVRLRSTPIDKSRLARKGNLDRVPEGNAIADAELTVRP